MKRLIACLLLLAMSIAVFAGCNEPTTPDVPEVTEPAENGLDNAIAYVKTAYKKAAENTAKDYQRVGKVPVGDTVYTVVWTVDVSEDLVKIEVAEDGLVTVNVNEGAEAETPYVLTATITDENGNVATHSWNHILPAGLNVDGLTYAHPSFGPCKERGIGCCGLWKNPCGMLLATAATLLSRAPR